jgi:hypothetical protein
LLHSFFAQLYTNNCATTKTNASKKFVLQKVCVCVCDKNNKQQTTNNKQQQTTTNNNKKTPTKKKTHTKKPQKTQKNHD